MLVKTTPRPGSSKARGELAELLADSFDDPGLFHEAVLGRPKLYPKQERMLESVCVNRYTVAPTAHAMGKTWGAVTAALHWLYTRPDSLVVTTSPSNTQLVNALWGGMKQAIARARFPLAGAVTEGSGSPQVLRLGPKWYAIGWAARKAESFQGQRPENGGRSLIIADESSGIEQPIWDAIESLGAASHLVLGNPIRATGHFRRLYETAASGAAGYAAFNLSAFDSPYAHLSYADLDRLGLPRGLATADWIEGIRRTYGEGSLYWQTRVLARFPDEDSDLLLPPAWIDRCGLARRSPGYAPPAVIVDISKGTGRDRAVVTVGDMLGIREMTESNRIGVSDAATLAVQRAKEHGVRPEHVIYDGGGWAGTDMARYLEALGFHGARAYFGSGSGGRRHANMRARAAWRLRQRLDPERPLRVQPVQHDPAPVPTRRREEEIRATAQPAFHIPRTLACYDELREELAELRYRHDGPKIMLEKKEKMAERLGRSPDLADTLIMLASAWDLDD